MKTLVHVNPIHEFRAMEEVFDRLFGRPASAPNAALLPIDIFEKEDKFVVKAAVTGVNPADLDIQIENNVLIIRGETKSGFEDGDAKVYRREISYGSFARSIRLPERLDFDKVEADFENGFVTVSIPKLEEEKPKAIKVNVRPLPESTETP